MRKKGLLFTVDMMVSVVFFMVIIVSMLWVWTHAQGTMTAYDLRMSRMERLTFLSQALVATPGRPANWHENGPYNADNILAIGFAKNANELTPERLDRFVSMDYEILRTIMGLGAEDFHLTVQEDWDGTPITHYEKGSVLDTSVVMVVERYALLEGTPVKMRVEVYYDR